MKFEANDRFGFKFSLENCSHLYLQLNYLE